MTNETLGTAVPHHRRVLVIGYGNPSRGDDGLGPALAERLEALRVPGVTVESDYQLAIEHGALAAAHDVVVFADAATDVAAGGDAYYFRPVRAARDAACLSHAASPAQVMSLARSCFGATPAGYVLGIRAEAIDGFREGLSAGAEAALDAALAFLLEFLRGVHSPPESETRDARRETRRSLYR